MVGSYIYAINNSDGSDVINVSNPAAPVRVSTTGPILAISGNLAYTDRDILDISNPTAIMQIGKFAPAPREIAPYGSSAVFARSGLETIRLNVGANQPATDISLSQTSIAENSPVGTVVGTLSSTCLNPSNTFTYSSYLMTWDWGRLGVLFTDQRQSARDHCELQLRGDEQLLDPHPLNGSDGPVVRQGLHDQCDECELNDGRGTLACRPAASPRTSRWERRVGTFEHD